MLQTVVIWSGAVVNLEGESWPLPSYRELRTDLVTGQFTFHVVELPSFGAWSTQVMASRSILFHASTPFP